MVIIDLQARDLSAFSCLMVLNAASQGWNVLNWQRWYWCIYFLSYLMNFVSLRFTILAPSCLLNFVSLRFTILVPWCEFFSYEEDLLLTLHVSEISSLSWQLFLMNCSFVLQLLNVLGQMIISSCKRLFWDSVALLLCFICLLYVIFCFLSLY